MRYCLNLPSPPAFPVYGVDQIAEKWLASWSSTSLLWQVTLGFGFPDGRQWTSVATILKIPETSLDSTSAIGPIGIGDAVVDANRRLMDMPHVVSSKKSGISTPAVAPWSDLSELDAFPLSSWDVTSFMVDGQAVPAYERVTSEGWGVVVDLANVAVSVSGSLSIGRDTLTLSRVNAQLDDFV
jgi:hypothetical protein